MQDQLKQETGLEPELLLCKDASYILTSNLSVSNNLVNGSKVKIVNIFFKEDPLKH